MKYALLIVVYLYTPNSTTLQEEYISHINLSASECIEQLDKVNIETYRNTVAPMHVGKEKYAYCVKMKNITRGKD